LTKESETMIDPISAAVGAAYDSSQIAGGLVDRFIKARQAKLDAKALRRMVLLEVRYNLAILKVAIHSKNPLPPEALWLVPALLRADSLEVVLGASKAANALTKTLEGVKVSDEDLLQDASGVIPNLYSRVTALKGLAALHRQVPLDKVKIELRLRNLLRDMLALRSVLAKRRPMLGS
jgi:hypothetical protein